MVLGWPRHEIMAAFRLEPFTELNALRYMHFG